MASADCESRPSSELCQPGSADTGSTTFERNDASGPDGTSIAYAAIVDIDTLAPTANGGLTIQRPSIDDLTCQGPSQIMKAAKPHSVGLRWIHLRSNCMFWVEELMARVREERGTPTLETFENLPTTENPILRKDLWAHLFHGRASERIQARFMGPTCTSFSPRLEDEESDSNGSTRENRDNIVLYMPFLHWESCKSWKERQDLIEAISAKKPGKPQPDIDFVTKYLHHKTAPFHDRRSLHQAYYHDLGMTRSVPYGEQVMQSFTSNKLEKPAKMMVVDQLWLWLIKGTGASEKGEETSQPDLVITAFSDRFNGAYDSANVYEGIIEHLKRGLQPPLRTANHLVGAILEHCTGVFFQRQLEPDMWFLEFFAAAIEDVREGQRLAFSEFCSLSEELQRLEEQKASTLEISGKLEDSAISISVETSLVRKIRKIIDELSCIDYILHRQQNVVRSLTRSQRSRSRSLENVSEIVKERRDTWAAIAHTAHVVYDEIQTQMDLKQKQASLSETRSSRHQAEDSARQGRIILLFTIVTIIFLPMGFLASWFGMNIRDPDAGNLYLYQIAAIIFPISIAIALFALVFAFSERLRNFVIRSVESVLDFVLGALNMLVSRKRRQHRRERRQQQEVALMTYRAENREMV